MKRLCLHCQHALAGRTDKKFCDDYCRNTYNNKRYREEFAAKREIQSALNHNYKVLREICVTNTVAESSLSDLHSRGYQMPFFTNLSLTGQGEVLRQCFDMGILTKENGKLFVIDMKNGSQGNYHQA